MATPAPPITPHPLPKPEDVLVTTPLKPLPSPSKTTFPTPPPSTVVGNWILYEHSFAPQREYFKAFCTGLARRRVTDHLMWFKFPSKGDHKKHMVPVHYSRLAWAGAALAELVVKPEPPHLPKDEKKEETDQAMDVDQVGKEVKPDGDVAQQSDVETPTKLKRSDPLDGIERMSAAADELEPDELYIRKDPVQLSKLDTPRTFAIVVKFLYCEEIKFNYLTFDEIVALATAAHRWQLTDLYNATFSYVMDQNLLSGGYGIRTFIPLVAHEETPESFRRYFAIAVGHHFDILYPRLRAVASTQRDVTPPLWEVVSKQNMISHVIHCIELYSRRSEYDAYLLDVILHHYEPHQPSDDKVLGVLSQLSWDDIDLAFVLSAAGPSAKWSARAIRLAALASYTPQTDALEIRIPWNIPLQKLLKTEVWSFQTELVPCGPYICYLHVRKGLGKELSLFVHIWNRDQKPIRDDARHELVRVKCRATERNCHCDSGKQWSDASHGFLESLRFEGKLERYPGLGWTSFLEARRIEEWSVCHGEDCGLAITTVLQFIKPSKQFEGPARRVPRGNSPARLSTPIQKKRSMTSRMKLRESR